LMLKYSDTENVRIFGLECLESEQIEKAGINSRDFYGLACYVEEHGGTV